jgi:hypothetical protein
VAVAVKPDAYRELVAKQMDEDTELLPNVTELAIRLGWLVFHDYDSLRNRAGFPDLIMLRAGRLLVVELKSHKGRLRPAQHVWLDAFAAVGGNVETYLWRPLDLLDGTVEKVLRAA